jgi:hypothetical protein
MNFGMDVMPSDAILNSYLIIPTVGGMNKADAQTFNLGVTLAPTASVV